MITLFEQFQKDLKVLMDRHGVRLLAGRDTIEVWQKKHISEEAPGQKLEDCTFQED